MSDMKINSDSLLGDAIDMWITWHVPYDLYDPDFGAVEYSDIYTIVTRFIRDGSLTPGDGELLTNPGYNVTGLVSDLTATAKAINTKRMV